MRSAKDQESKIRSGERSNTIVIVGGHGGMTAKYRETVERCGWKLRHFERTVPAGTRRKLGNVAMVVVFASMVSHALLQQITDSVGRDVRIVYLRTASVSTLRTALARTVLGYEFRA